MYLIRLADQESMAFPSLNTIAKVCCMSKRSVQRAIDELIAAGLLVKRQRKKRGSQECDSNEYAILDPRPVAKEKAHLNDIDTPSYSHTDTTSRSFAPNEGQSPRGQKVNISAFDFWAFVLHDKLSELDYGEYMRYCVDMEYREQILEGWREQWVREMGGEATPERRVG